MTSERHQRRGKRVRVLPSSLQENADHHQVLALAGMDALGSDSDKAGGRLDYECPVYVDSSRPPCAKSGRSMERAAERQRL
jgi:hypothetical protein